MPKYKLCYFNGRGRAEVIRLCFAAAGVEYEDVRFSSEDWKVKKEEGFSPLEYLPLIEVNGKKCCESMAIVRYVARETGLSPTDSFEVLLCDQIVEACGDCFRSLAKVYFEKDEEKKKPLKEELDNILLPSFLTKMTRLLKSNNDGKGFFVGDKLTYADIVLYNITEWFDPGATDKFPEIKAFLQRVRDIKGIKEWLEKRPETPF